MHLCKNTTFQRSYLNRSSRIWNTLASSIEGFCDGNLPTFHANLFQYYSHAVVYCYNPEDPRTWKTICPSCNTASHLNANITCCSECFFLSLSYLNVLECFLAFLGYPGPGVIGLCCCGFPPYLIYLFISLIVSVFKA